MSPALQQLVRAAWGSLAAAVGTGRLPLGNGSGPEIQPEVCPPHGAPLHPLLLPGCWAGTLACGHGPGQSPSPGGECCVSPLCSSMFQMVPSLKKVSEPILLTRALL